MNDSWLPERIRRDHLNSDVQREQECISAILIGDPVQATLSEKTDFQPRCSSAGSLYNPRKTRQLP